MRWPSTLRWRLTFWYTALLAVPFVAIAVGFYALFARTLSTRTDRFIDDALTAFSRELVAERRAALTADGAIRSTVDEVRFRDLHIAVLDSAYRVAAMTPLPSGEARAGATAQASFDAWIGRALRESGATPSAMTVRDRGGGFRVLARPVSLAGDAFVVTGAYSIADTDEVLARLRSLLAIVIPLLVVGAAGGGYFMATRSLAPVSAMAERATEITATSLRERLPVSGGEELAGLARVVNDLLARLEESFAQQRRFMADASHELRTPTAIVRTEADVTLAQTHRSEDEYRASVTVMRDAARRLTRIVDDLFALARVDAENVSAKRERLYAEEVVDDAMRMVRPLADSRAVRVELRAAVEAPVEGDADLLGRLLVNLLDNAIKHSPDGGVVDIGMRRRDSVVDVTIVDQGQGIPQADRDRIFERFVRLADDRAASSEQAESRRDGAGLGLAIARRIAEAHGGSLVVVESEPGHTEFCLTLPIA
jgi:heavy metal sensor kinase